MARASNTYRSNNPGNAKGRGKLRRILKAQEKSGVETPDLNKIRDLMENKTDTVETTPVVTEIE